MLGKKKEQIFVDEPPPLDQATVETPAPMPVVKQRGKIPWLWILIVFLLVTLVLVALGRVGGETTNLPPVEGTSATATETVTLPETEEKFTPGVEDLPTVVEGAAVTPAKCPRIHKVRSGQTLFAISRKYYGKADQSTVAKIMEANSIIKNPDRIKVGWKLCIP